MIVESVLPSLVVAAGDTQPLEQCKLYWRWTDRRRAEFSPEELAQIQCLSARKAGQLDDYLTRTLEAWQSYTLTADSKLTTSTDGDPQAVRDWLEHSWTNQQAVARVSWDLRTAFDVPWCLFARRWDDFCYPSSDDVAIAIAAGEWFLEYAHYDQMRWLARPPTARPN